MHQLPTGRVVAPRLAYSYTHMHACTERAVSEQWLPPAWQHLCMHPCLCPPLVRHAPCRCMTGARCRSPSPMRFSRARARRAGRAFEAQQKQQRREAVRSACKELPVEVRDALRAVRVRVSEDKLPLLSLLQAEPFQMQSSHLTFQEYFTAVQICTGRALPSSSPPPWRWEAWWLNTLRLGAEMGEGFGRGLKVAAGEPGDTLNLKGRTGGHICQRRSSPPPSSCMHAHICIHAGRIGGHLPTALLAVSQLMRGLVSINLSSNALTPTHGLAIAEGVRTSACLESLLLASNQLCGVCFDNGRFSGEYDASGIQAIAQALHASGSLTRLDLSQNSLGVSYVNGKRAASMEGISVVAQAVGSSTSLTEVNVSYNSIGPMGGKVIADAVASSKTLSQLDISGNLIGLKGGRAICDALETNPSFTFADLRFNSLDEATKQEIANAVSLRSDLRVDM